MQDWLSRWQDQIQTQKRKADTSLEAKDKKAKTDQVRIIQLHTLQVLPPLWLNPLEEAKQEDEVSP
jgi:hypothetical protein